MLGGATYAYDIFNHLTSATPAGGSAATLAAGRLAQVAGAVTLSYDALGRLSQSAGGSTSRFLYDAENMIAEYDASNALQRRYVFGPNVNEPIVWYEGAGTGDRRYLIADPQGSIVAVNGAATAIYAYDEYGVPNTWSGPRFRYTGQMALPEAQLYHFRARAYHPTLGRFLQTDPLGYADGANLYAYVSNRPTSAADPSGLCETYTGSRICGNSGGFLYIYYISGAAPLSNYQHGQQAKSMVICGASCAGLPPGFQDLSGLGSDFDSAVAYLTRIGQTFGALINNVSNMPFVDSPLEFGGLIGRYGDTLAASPLSGLTTFAQNLPGYSTLIEDRYPDFQTIYTWHFHVDPGRYGNAEIFYGFSSRDVRTSAMSSLPGAFVVMSDRVLWMSSHDAVDAAPSRRPFPGTIVRRW